MVVINLKTWKVAYVNMWWCLSFTWGTTIARLRTPRERPGNKMSNIINTIDYRIRQDLVVFNKEIKWNSNHVVGYYVPCPDPEDAEKIEASAKGILKVIWNDIKRQQQLVINNKSTNIFSIVFKIKLKFLIAWTRRC